MPRGPTPRALAVGRGPWAVAGGVLRRAPRGALALSAQHRSTAARLPILSHYRARGPARECASQCGWQHVPAVCVSVSLLIYVKLVDQWYGRCFIRRLLRSGRPARGRY